MTAAFDHVYRVKKGRIVGFQQFTDTLKVAEAMRCRDCSLSLQTGQQSFGLLL